MRINKMIKKKICIIDYGMGNIHSVYNALVTLGIKPIVSNKKEELNKADAFILPGVGAFPNAINNLLELDLVDEIKKQVLIKNKNILGICLGMQLLADSSEEGGFNKGLSFIPGKVTDLAKKVKVRVPHIGWNSLNIYNNSLLFNSIPNEQDFYFVHRYYYECNSKYIIASTEYEIMITAAIKYKNIYGVQFHPERSHNTGIKLLYNFINF
jgi:imidazole glycerol-phosphate synthase subunit HisH